MRPLMRANAAIVAAFLLLAPGVADAKDKKKDPEAIGDRDVGKGVNFYSLEKRSPWAKATPRRSSVRRR
jgi:hypothetical protein